MDMECKTWVNYRLEEMEEKAGFVPVDFENLPEKDMDGCAFVPYFTPEEEIKMEDAYNNSISSRLYRYTIDITGM